MLQAWNFVKNNDTVGLSELNTLFKIIENNPTEDLFLLNQPEPIQTSHFITFDSLEEFGQLSRKFKSFRDHRKEVLRKSR